MAAALAVVVQTEALQGAAAGGGSSLGGSTGGGSTGVVALEVVALEVAALEVAALEVALVEAVLEQFHPSKGVLLMDRSLERQSLSMSTAIMCRTLMSRVGPLILAGFIR